MGRGLGGVWVGYGWDGVESSKGEESGLERSVVEVGEGGRRLESLHTSSEDIRPVTQHFLEFRSWLCVVVVGEPPPDIRLVF